MILFETKSFSYKPKDFLMLNLELSFHIQNHVSFLGSKFSRSHCRLRTPSYTFWTFTVGVYELVLSISPKGVSSPSCYYLNVAPPYPTRPGGRTGSGDVDQFYHIYIFEYYRNKCRIIISVKEGPSFCQLTLSLNMACMPFQHYHLQNIIRVHLHK